MKDFLTTALPEIKESSVPAGVIRMAMDVGSTQTRCCIYNETTPIIAEHVIDSNYEIFTRSVDHVISPNKTVLAALDMELTDITADTKPSVLFKTAHVVKGELLQCLTNTRQVTSSGSSKIDQEATYINIISNIGLLLLDLYAEQGKPKGVPEIDLSISLPPEDTRFVQRLEVFRMRLAGKYKVSFSRLGQEVEFEIKDKISVISEPEAVAVYLTIMDALKDEDDSVVCCIDIGGRSTGITFVDNKSLMTDSCVTVALGGQRLLALLGRNIAAERNIQEPPTTRLMGSLKTGTFKLGAQKVDITAELNAAKQEFAGLIFNELVTALDVNNIQAQNVSKVFCSGRTFEDGTGSPSIMTVLAKMFQERSAYTEFVKVDNDNPIMYGLFYHGFL